MKEVWDQNNVETGSEITFERVARNGVIAVGKAEFRGVFLRYGENIRPVGTIDLGI